MERYPRDEPQPTKLLPRRWLPAIDGAHEGLFRAIQCNSAGSTDTTCLIDHFRTTQNTLQIDYCRGPRRSYVHEIKRASALTGVGVHCKWGVDTVLAPSRPAIRILNFMQVQRLVNRRGGAKTLPKMRRPVIDSSRITTVQKVLHFRPGGHCIFETKIGRTVIVPYHHFRRLSSSSLPVGHSAGTDPTAQARGHASIMLHFAEIIARSVCSTDFVVGNF